MDRTSEAKEPRAIADVINEQEVQQGEARFKTDGHAGPILSTVIPRPLAASDMNEPYA